MAQRQFRSDDTDKWVYSFGSAANGNYSSAGSDTVGANQLVYSQSFNGTATQTTGTLGGVWSWDAPVWIHQTRGTGAGAHELNWATATGGTSITFKHPLMNTYTTDTGYNRAQITTLAQWNNFTINSGHTLTLNSWNQNYGGVLPILASNKVSIAGTINASGADRSGSTGGRTRGGFWGGDVYSSGEGHLYAFSSPGSDSAGARGDKNGNQGGGGGNGTAGSGSGGPYGQGGTVSGNAGLTSITFGGGGGGDDEYPDYGIAGGQGGGIVVIIARQIEITGSINISGGNGGWMSPGRAGGGGAGGSLLMKTQRATLGTNLIPAAGGGTTAGGNGRIHLDYSAIYSGSATVGIDVRQDFSLNDAGGAVIWNFI